MLEDAYSRRFQYLRLSLTDRCNFRCAYCLPNGFQADPCHKGQAELSRTEIVRLSRAFSKLGTTKIRLTGGEPTLRHDLVAVVDDLKSIVGFEKIALTTNGFRLPSLLPKLKTAGLSSLNISLDSLDAETFAHITGSRLGHSIKNSIEDALSIGFPSVKINVVLLKDTIQNDLPRFMDWIQNRPLSVRFIELMKTGDNATYFAQEHVSSKLLLELLLEQGWTPCPRLTTDGPAQEYAHPAYAGRIGIIAPYSKDFCQGCNRLRVSARGDLKLCLFGEGQVSLRHLLESDTQLDELCELLPQFVLQKPKSHFLQEGRHGNTRFLASIGG